MTLDTASPAAVTRVLVVDDHAVVRAGIRATLDDEGDMRVVAEAGDVDSAVRMAVEHDPDVVVMDVKLADRSGIEATREILARRPAARVVMLTSFADDEALMASILAGASGYVLKQVRTDELVEAVRTVAGGKALLDPAITGAVLAQVRRSRDVLRDEKLARLSVQEERVLELVAEGCTNRQIGERLRLSDKTVKNYVSTVLAKLDVARRAEAASYLARHRRRLGGWE